MIEELSRTKRNLVLGALAVLVGWFAWTIRGVLNPVLLGYLCCFILHPVVLGIERRGFSRRTAVNLTFAAGFVSVVLMLLVAVWQVGSLAQEIYEGSAPGPPVEAPAGGAADGEDPAGEAAAAHQERPTARPGSLRARLDRRVAEFYAAAERNGFDLGQPPPVPGLDELSTLAGDYLEENRGQVGATTLEVADRGLRFLRNFLRRLTSLAGMFLLLPLYTYYFLFVQKDLHEFTRSCLPKRHRARISRVGEDIAEVVASFFRGRLSVCLIKGVLLWIGLALFGVRYSFLFGMTSGLLSVIPFFGPLLGFLATFAVDFPTHPEGSLWGMDTHGVLPSLIRCGLVFGLAELVEGYVLVPKILGDSLGLHPMVVFVALLAGGASLGMLGVLVALPLTAVLVILAKEFVLPALHDFAEEGPAGDD